MNYSINNTSSYHINEMETLGWELTVCNSLENNNSICRSILKESKSYGNHLNDYLVEILPFNKIVNVIEIGGGYGYLMRDLLIKNHNFNASMVDISTFLLDKQKKTLKNFTVEFYLRDFFTFNSDFFKNYDFAILNENIGDFPTICNLNPNIFNKSSSELDKNMLIVKEYFNKYSLNKPDINFNFNFGAFQAAELLCSAGVKFIFLSEHSCESVLPSEIFCNEDRKITGNPEKIPLKGHDEYTIKFSFLKMIGEKFNYSVIRGNFTDFLKYEFSDRIRIILKSNLKIDKHEIIRHFIYDLYKYEYLLMIKK